MNFCVLVKISKRIVSFWYQSEGSAYAPLTVKHSNEVPLYFYVNNNDFTFGNAARDRFYSNDPNAFGNYFEIVKDPSKHFTIYGNKKPVKQLLYYGIEQNLSFFINTVLYKNDSIESYRPQFPLRFIFETDIEEKEKSLVESLFIETGYHNVESIDYNESLFEVIRTKGLLNAGKPALLLNGIDNTLYMELYRSLSEPAVGFSKLEGQGADPRVKILADMIVEYVATQNPFLSLNSDAERDALLPYCVTLLENEVPIIKGEAVLTDGIAYFFRVKKINLDERLLYYSNDSIIYSAINDLLKTHGLKADGATILLGSEEINTSYFITRLSKNYSDVKGIGVAQHMETMKLIFSKMAQANYVAKRKSMESARPEMPVQRPAAPASNVEAGKNVQPPLPTFLNNAAGNDLSAGAPKKPVTPPLPPALKTDKGLQKPKLPPLPPEKKKD